MCHVLPVGVGDGASLSTTAAAVLADLGVHVDERGGARGRRGQRAAALVASASVAVGAIVMADFESVRSIRGAEALRPGPACHRRARDEPCGGRRVPGRQAVAGVLRLRALRAHGLGGGDADAGEPGLRATTHVTLPLSDDTGGIEHGRAGRHAVRTRRCARRRSRPDRAPLPVAGQHERRGDVPRAHRVRPPRGAMGVQRAHPGRPDAGMAGARRVRARRGRVGAGAGRAAADHGRSPPELLPPLDRAWAWAHAQASPGVGIAFARGSRRRSRRSTSRGC